MIALIFKAEEDSVGSKGEEGMARPGNSTYPDLPILGGGQQEVGTALRSLECWVKSSWKDFA